MSGLVVWDFDGTLAAGPRPRLRSLEASWAFVSQELALACTKVGFSQERADTLARLVRTSRVDPATSWRLFEDTVPALERMRAAGWRQVILSNQVPELAQVVEGLGLAKYVEGAYSSAVTGFEKPHPQAFAFALRRREEAKPVWMVGDDPEADVEGAEKAGLRGLLVRSNDLGVGDAVERILSA